MERQGWSRDKKLPVASVVVVVVVDVESSALFIVENFAQSYFIFAVPSSLL
jgi:hypothetical protein